MLDNELLGMMGLGPALDAGVEWSVFCLRREEEYEVEADAEKRPGREAR